MKIGKTFFHEWYEMGDDGAPQGITPEMQKELIKKTGAKNWYDWCCQNWGTKWGAYDVDFTPHTKRGALLSFRSAWSPPADQVFQALSEKFPDLTFEIEYFEGGAAYCGGMTFYAKSECEDYECEFGTPTSKWSGDYSGSRGG